VLYRDGVYLVSGQHKGAMLQLLLRRLGKSYPAIVFLDDREKNVCEMATAYDELPEVLTAFRYDRERLSAQAFLQDPARQERAIQDWARLTGRLPPLCEAVPETCTLVAGPVPAPGPEPTPERTVVFPDRPLRITTWNLQHMMSEPVFAQWAAACAPHGWDDEAARAAGKPVTLTYCNAHNGLNWPCGDRQESLPLDTAAAFERKAAALRARAAALAADIYAFQEVSDPGAVARILPPDYALFFVPAPVAMNVAFAVRQELAGAVQVRPLMALSVCDLPDRADPADPASCLEGVYRTRPGLELTLSTPSGTVALLNVHLKSSCRSHPVSAPRLDTLKARTCERPDFDQATADAEYRASVQAGCARLRDQVPAIEAWVDSQAEAGHNFMVLGDFNRDFVRELTTGMPARLDGTDARDPILPTTEIASVLKEVSDRSPPGTFLYLVRQRLDTQDRTCRTPAGETYQVQGCHERIDNFLIGSRWAESVSDDPKGLTATGSDYGDGGYCAENARPSDHCPITLEITLPKAAPPVVGGPPPSIPPPVVVPPPTDLPMPPDSLMGEALRAWLRAHWYEGHHRTLGYDAARRALYSSVSVAPDARVYGVYSGFSQPAEDTTFLDPINAEHTVPQSFFGRGDPMGLDLHHLFPTHKDVNSARGSDPFGEIPDAATARWFGLKANGQLAKLGAIPPGNLDVYSEDRPEVFEPREGHEGDLARAVFYFYTVYPGRAGPLERITQDGIATLYKWHRDDPPDDWERGRNDRIAAVQGNRNFYIDRPDLVCRAWGLACD
jgi:endonuclease/exonuclease/phosphatase family metal-dependent hydrolase